MRGGGFGARAVDFAMNDTDKLPPRWQEVLNQIDAHHRAMLRYVPPVGLPFVPTLLGAIAFGFVAVLVVGVLLGVMQ